MTREEILNLDKMSEGEQIRWLAEHDILQTTIMQCPISRAHQWGHYESLADCAFRLSEDIHKDNLIAVVRHVLGAEAVPSEVYDYYAALIYWVYASRPINWIQAALLAKGEGK
jgi:hypothetical protein